MDSAVTYAGLAPPHKAARVRQTLVNLAGKIEDAFAMPFRSISIPE